MAKLNPLTRLLDWIVLEGSKRLGKGTTERHVAIYRKTGGLLGGRIRELPVLLLTTTGRKSGEPRTQPLNYLRYGTAYVVAASNSGRDSYPAWFLNLQSNPRASVQVRRKVVPVVARVATEEEHARLWVELTSKARNYAAYTRMTERDIPMLILQPEARGKEQNG
ncbi:MAG TPA: nitroreductase family deazaflavin-dependent oxidoreductase [Chloroflexia bacterium]|nr:nitroreductase family deazaflavin-dependent oxidoreductase [Chloroflexia bacterium]